MSNDEYTAIQEVLLGQAKVIGMLDLDGFIASIDRADSIGPIVDPTLWRAAHERMRKIRSVAVAAWKVKQAFEELQKHIVDGEKSYSQ